MVEAALPPLAPVPPPSIQKLVPDDEWKACLDAWIASVELRLQMTDKAFDLAARKDETAKSFLSSYYSHGSALPSRVSMTKATNLRRLCFLLTRRLLLTGHRTCPELLDWKFLGQLSDCYHSTTALKSLLSELWNRDAQAMALSVEKGMSIIMQTLPPNVSESQADLNTNLRLLTVYASSLPAVGHVLMTGSDYIDALFEAYSAQTNETLRKVIVAQVYVALLSLLKLRPPAISLLLDQLYSLKSSAKVDIKTPKTEPTLLSALVCSSGLLSRLEAQLAGSQQQKRGDSLIASLRSYRSQYSAVHKPYRRPKRIDKGKGRADQTSAENEFHIHRMSRVTQIQDLFPDLGSGYVVKLLDNYADDVETVISHLVEDSLPPHLKDLDQSAQLEGLEITQDIVPRSTPPPSIPTSDSTRKNVFDNDEFDRLAISSSQLHIGRANTKLTADNLLADKSGSANKSAILSALAAFDSDDDERDDTYDVEDVGGTVDSMPTGTGADSDEALQRKDRENQANMSLQIRLFQLYQSNPGSFGRDSTTRRSQQRAALRKDTGMTDEAIEGWAIMLSRDPKKKANFERTMALSAGLGGGSSQQNELPSTSYRRPAATDIEGSEADSSGGRGRGRGGRGGRGRGGGRGGAKDTSGPSGGPESALAKRKKDANKGSRANHNRRDQRAKKMARGGL